MNSPLFLNKILRQINKLPVILFFVSFTIFFGIYFVALFYANIDLSSSSSVLFMDETISFGGIEKIYHCENFKDFFLNVIDGKDQRYGRIMWNIYAITSYIPYLIFGETGQIIATRFTQVFILFAAYFVLVHSFIKSFYLKIVAFSLLLCLPSTPYYASMPKPDPLQLLFLSLFLMFVLRDGLQKSKKWILLGISFGAKISVLPYAICLFALNLLNFSFSQEAKIALKNSAKNFGFFFLGLVIAVPIFLRGRVAIYIKSTFKTTGHGSDNSLIDASSWIKFMRDEYLYPVFWPVLLIVATMMIYYFYKFYKAKNLNFLKDDKLSLLLIGSACLFFPIILKTQRLWGFYLHNALVLLAVAYFVVIEDIIVRFKNSALVKILLLFCAILISVIFVNFYVNTIEKYRELSQRTSLEEYKIKDQEYQFLTGFLVKLYDFKVEKIHALFDTSMFLIKPNEKYGFDPILGPLRYWDLNYDVIIIQKQKLDFSKIKETDAEYQEFLMARKMYGEYLSPRGKLCKKEQCYFEYKDHALNNVTIFLNQKFSKFK